MLSPTNDQQPTRRAKAPRDKASGSTLSTPGICLIHSTKPCLMHSSLILRMMPLITSEVPTPLLIALTETLLSHHATTLSPCHRGPYNKHMCSTMMHSRMLIWCLASSRSHSRTTRSSSNTPPPPHLLASVANSITPGGRGPPRASVHAHFAYRPCESKNQLYLPPEQRSASRHHSNSATAFLKCHNGMQKASLIALFFKILCTATNGFRRFRRYNLPSSTPVHAHVSFPTILASSVQDMLCWA
mmetsp:Transcript_61520/g.127095  ORF Transcript_61520/g.127095 Transcript_61520/m.127095 type:complete len:244 (-) Transcript_61520:1512-2243(-)